jgi:hypothetical protein
MHDCVIRDARRGAQICEATKAQCDAADPDTGPLSLDGFRNRFHDITKRPWTENLAGNQEDETMKQIALENVKPAWIQTDIQCAIGITTI